MTTRPGSISARQLLRDHRTSDKSEQDRNELWTYYVIRPASFYPTALFLQLGISANAVTWISIAALVAGCLLLATSSFPTALIGALAINLWVLLDCVDGNIARHLRSSSAYGVFIDSIGGYAAYALIYLSLGVGAYVDPERLLLPRLLPRLLDARLAIDGAVWLILGAWSSLAALWVRLVFQKFRSIFDDAGMRRHDVLDPPSVGHRMASNLLNLSGGLPVLALLALLLGVLDLMLLLAALGNTAMSLVVLRRLLRRAAALEAVAETSAGPGTTVTQADPPCSGAAGHPVHRVDGSLHATAALATVAEHASPPIRGGSAPVQETGAGPAHRDPSRPAATRRRRHQPGR